jgi:hypothetical protein
MDGVIVPPSNIQPDQALSVELAASNWDNGPSARIVGGLWATRGRKSDG